MESTILSIKNLHKRYGKIHAVNNVSLEIHKGNVYGILGPNGSGKSTTLGIVLNVVNKTSGEYSWFDGTMQTHEALKKVGAIIERPDLYPYLTAREHLQLFAKLRSKQITTSSINDTLIKVGLIERAHDKVQTFSLGMKQRLGIAIALVHNPSLIILDEPTNGLDPQGISDIRNLIKQLAQQEGKTVLVSSHLLSEIEQMATQIMIIHRGQKIAEGPIQKLLDPNKMVVHVKTTNDTHALQVILSGRFSNYLLQRTDGIHLCMPDYEIPLFNTSLVNAGIGLVGVETRNSLEDYFLQVTSNSN